MTYHRPSDLDSALRCAALPGGQIIAGGTDVYPALKQGVSPEHYLDVTDVADMIGITQDSDGYRIGGATSWTNILDAPLPAAFDALKTAARQVGSVQIQNAGTIAGNLCNASPAADGVPPLMCLNAQVELSSAARGTRILPLQEFLLGVRRTAREDDELVTAILIPDVHGDLRSAFHKLGSRAYLVISISMVAAAVRLDGNGRITDARVCVGACSPVAQRLSALEAACIGKHASDVQVTPDHLSDLTPIDDVRGTSGYRLDAVAEQCHRALIMAAGT